MQFVNGRQHSRRPRCGVPEMGRDGMREPHGKKTGLYLNNRKGFVGYEKYIEGHSRRRRARIGGFGRIGRHARRRQGKGLRPMRRQHRLWPASPRPNDKGEWTGLDVDFCRAVAAAVFGDGSKVKFTPLSAKERFTALQSGEIDLLSRNTTWTINRDTALGLNFAGVTYYDGQGFMINAKKLPGVNSALQLSGASVCVQSGHHDRTQPRRLFQGQQDRVQSGRLREARRGQRRL